MRRALMRSTTIRPVQTDAQAACLICPLAKKGQSSFGTFLSRKVHVFYLN